MTLYLVYSSSIHTRVTEKLYIRLNKHNRLTLYLSDVQVNYPKDTGFALYLFHSFR